jgi:hypothetical protein
MPKKTFQDRFTPEWTAFTWLRYVILAALSVHVVLASVSGYRAWVQVKSLDVRLAGPVVRPGSKIQIDVVTSGRVTNEVLLELIQDNTISNPLEGVELTHHSALARYWVAENQNFFYDPRSRHATFSFVVDSAALAHFDSGPALLRVTARGRSQFLRIPPPLVRNLSVDLRTS